MRNRSALFTLDALFFLLMACTLSSTRAFPTATPTEAAPVMAQIQAQPTSPTGLTGETRSTATPVTTETNEILSPTGDPTQVDLAFTDVVYELIPEGEVVNAQDPGRNSGHGCLPSSQDPAMLLPPGIEEFPLTISVEGTLTGQCDQEIGNQRNTGSLTGEVNFTEGTVVFHAETREDNNDEGVIVTVNMVYDGMGKLETPSTASGEATWTLTCTNPGEAMCAVVSRADPESFQPR